MTLKKIAELAGVSVSTVSKVMHGSNEISEETAAAVKNAARELGCLEKYYKGEYEKIVIAVILPEIGSEFYSNIASEITVFAEERGATVIFAQSLFDKNKCMEIADYLSFRGMADGIIVIGHSELKRKLDIPFVIIDGDAENDSDCIRMSIDNAVFAAVKYLIKCGHKKIAYIGEPRTMVKLELLKTALNKNNVPLKQEYTYISDNRFMSAGFCGANHLLSLENPPTAIVAAYDYIALGIIEYFKMHNISMPEDISVIGMDNIIAASCSNLTSIASDYKGACREAVDLLFKRIENKYYCPKQNIAFEGELIIRESVKKIR